MNNKLNQTEKKPIKKYKPLPDAFNRTDDEFSIAKSLLISTALHPMAVILIWALVVLLALFGISFSLFQKPKPKTRDIEFVLVEKEAPPINKNTKFRSDKNSRAGGHHDPTKKVSLPQPSAKKSSPSKPSPKKAQPKPVTMQKMFKQLFDQPAQKPQAKPGPKSPAPPSAKPAPRPSKAPSNRPMASAPKIAAKPNSPFQIATPDTDAPIGLAPSGGSNSGSSRGSSASRGSSGGPSPTLAPSRSGSGTGASGASRGGYGSAGNPGPGNPNGAPGIDAIKNPDWGPYMRELERRIKRNWDPPKGNESKRVVMLFKIGRDGRLLSVRVVKSSGNAAADQAARSAVELTAPFKSLPPEFKNSSVDIEFTFDYNVFGASYR